MAYKGANNSVTPADVENRKAALQNTRVFAWTSLTYDESIAAIERAVDIAKQAGALIVAAPSISIITNRRTDAERLVKKADIISLNDEEVEALTGVHDPIKGAQALIGWGLKLVNVTMGGDGAYLTDGQTLVRTGVYKMKVMDTTGAGDATMAGMIYGYLNKMPIQEIAKHSAALSAMEIGSTGVRVGLPGCYETLMTFINQHEVEQDILTF
jgi:sugar/nucleoside kinase (ribokinase family)